MIEFGDDECVEHLIETFILEDMDNYDDDNYRT